jgi:hypothetical protein
MEIVVLSLQISVMIGGYMKKFMTTLLIFIVFKVNSIKCMRCICVGRNGFLLQNQHYHSDEWAGNDEN